MNGKERTWRMIDIFTAARFDESICPRKKYSIDYSVIKPIYRQSLSRRSAQHRNLLLAGDKDLSLGVLDNYFRFLFTSGLRRK